MTISYKNGKIYYEESGSGNPLILLHGYAESVKIWQDYKESLSKKFRTIMIDLPGHGQSSMFDEVHTMELMADCVKAVLDHLNLSAVVMVGHSMGGYASLAFARKYSRMLKGLGLFHSTSLADTDETKEMRERSVEAISQDHSGFLLNFIPELFAAETREFYQSDIQNLIDEASTIDPSGLIAAQKGMKDRTSTLDVLINASFPVMFIAGQKDSRVPFENIWVQMALTETAHSLILRNVGHMGFIEAKNQCLNFMESFTVSCFSLR